MLKMDLRKSVLCGLLLLLSYSSATFVNDDFTKHLLHDGTVTRATVKAFYEEFSSENSGVSRCSFVELMAFTYGMKNLDASTWFDLMQTDNGTNLNLDEFEKEILEGKTELTSAEFNIFLNKLQTKTHSAETEPYRYTAGQNKPEVEAFQVDKWVRTVDQNGDKIVTYEEISNVMWTLDNDGKTVLKSCEFTRYMASEFNQHPIVAHKVYDYIFRTTDKTWSDADSKLLILSISSRKANVADAEFARFFGMLNNVESGKEKRLH